MMFFQHGADVNIMNDTGDTPLHKAVYTSRMVRHCRIFISIIGQSTMYDELFLDW